MTALGPIRLGRSYACCAACEQGLFAADRLLGIDGWLTPRALQMACRAGIADPFRKAEFLLSELAGWSVDADTLRRRCHEQATRAAARRADRTGLPEAFTQAAGDYELHIDAGKVNTVEDHWRDVKVAVFARRQRGEPCDMAGLEQRDLPEPSVRSVVAAVAGREEFGMRLETEALRLAVPLSAGLSLLGDGAEWIWNLAEDHFYGAAQLLDIWHGVEHLAAAGRAALADGEPFQGWLRQAKEKLVGDGYAGVCQALASLSVVAGASRPACAAVAEALNYFAAQQGRLGYAVRLVRGQAIGSGLVEGTIKQLVNLRMKRTGARWRVFGVGPFVEFVALADGPEWYEYWASLAA